MEDVRFNQGAATDSLAAPEQDGAGLRWTRPFAVSLDRDGPADIPYEGLPTGSLARSV